MLQEVRKRIKESADPKRAKTSTWFFKTKKGEYGYGDVFLGLTVPQQRKIAAEFKNLSLQDVEELLHSKFHEERLIALFILVLQFKKMDEGQREKLYAFYLSNTKYINNWDLVDSSADKIVGEYLLDKDRDVLEKLAASESVWERRIAMIATYQFIKNGDCDTTFVIAKILLNDKHDLIHKAVGWMLREAGQRCSLPAEETFLKKHYKEMPRTMLRYAIELFPPEKRKMYLSGSL